MRLKARGPVMVEHRVETSLYCMTYFDILNRLGVTHGCDGRTDWRTDIIAANAALQYNALPKRDDWDAVGSSHPTTVVGVEITSSEQSQASSLLSMASHWCIVV